MCSTSMTFTINTNYKAPCVEKSAGRVEYYGVPCGSNGDQIMWLKARAIDLRVSVSPADCDWDWTKYAERAFYGGFCGIAPTVPGRSGLLTNCSMPRVPRGLFIGCQHTTGRLSREYPTGAGGGQLAFKAPEKCFGGSSPPPRRTAHYVHRPWR